MPEPFNKHEKLKIVVKGKPPFTCYVAAVNEDGSLFLNANKAEYGMFWADPLTQNDSSDEYDGNEVDINEPDRKN